METDPVSSRRPHTPAPNASAPGIPASVQEVVDLYQRRAEQLRFPGVDADALVSAVEEFRVLSSQVERLRAEAQGAQRAAAEAEAQLVALGKRAFAYAKLYAEDDVTLGEELGGFHFAKPEKGRLPKAGRRGGSGARSRSAAVSRADGAVASDDQKALPGLQAASGSARRT